MGCGNIGRLRAKAVRRSRRHRLAAVADLDEARAASVAGSDAPVASDWREVLDPDRVDAVVVSTPPSTHLEICRGAVEAGCHVLCEKPLARSSAECRILLEAAASAGVRLATGFNFRFFPPTRRARELLHEEVLGRPLHLRGYAGYRFAEGSPGWMRDAEETGGGVLRDIGVHLIDLTRHLLGEIVPVGGVATAGTLGVDGCEDNAALVLTAGDGAVVSLDVSWTEWRDYGFRIELMGSEGVARFSYFPMFVSVTTREPGRLRWRDRRSLFPASFLAEHLGSYERVVVESLVRELDAFAEHVEGRPSAVATGQDGARAVEIAEAVTTEAGKAATPKRDAP